MPGQTWGNSVGSGSGSTLTIEYDGVEVSGDGSQARIYGARIKFYSKSGWSDSTNSITAQGSAVDDVVVHSGTLNGGERVWNVTGTWTPIAYGSTTYVVFEAKVVGISFFNGDAATSYYSIGINLPERGYSPPNPPLNYSGSYVNDNRIDQSWQANYTGANGATPWSGLRLDRWSKATNSWGRIANLNWDATSYSDTGVAANGEYRYALWSYNPAGESSHVHIGPFYTTPAAPGKPTTEKLADGTIRITAANNAPSANRWEFQDSPNGTTWANLTTTATSPTYDHTAPNPAVTHRYRVRAKTPDGKVSSWSLVSDVVLLQQPPNAPTWATIDPAFDAPLAITTPWTHNPVDGSPQTAYEAQWASSDDNGATWSAWTTTGKVVSTTQSRTWAGATFPQNRLIRRQVRTWGAHATAGAWSATATFQTSAPPTTSITTPASGAVVRSKRITAQWAFSDPEGSSQASYEVALYATVGGVLLGQWSGSGSANSFAVPYDLADDSGYRVDVRTRDGAGIWSAWSTSPFTTDFLPPPAAEVTARWDVTRGAAVLSIYNPLPVGSEPSPVFNRVYRDGVLIGDNVGLNSAFVDPLAPVAGGVYTVETISSLPSNNDTLVELSADPEVYRRFWLNAGPGWSAVASFYGNVKRSQTQGRVRALERYSGRELEVSTIGEGRVSKFGASATLVTAEDSPQDFFDIANQPTDICFRDFRGTWFVSVEPISESSEVDSISTISVSMTEVDTAQVPTVLDTSYALSTTDHAANLIP